MASTTASSWDTTAGMHHDTTMGPATAAGSTWDTASMHHDSHQWADPAMMASTTAAGSWDTTAGMHHDTTGAATATDPCDKGAFEKQMWDFKEMGWPQADL